MSIKCLLGFHDWGRQENIEAGAGSCHPIMAIFDFFVSRKCTRTCLRCNKTKEFIYDSRRG